jgi:chitinase
MNIRIPIVKLQSKILPVILFVASIAACTNERSDPVVVSPAADLPIIAYHFGDTSNIRQHSVGDLSQIIFSFLKLNGNELAIETEQQRSDIVNLVSLKKDYPDLKVLVALGGWGGCETCSEVFSTVEGRDEFVASVKAMLIEYDLDGLDLDWEYPAIEGWSERCETHWEPTTN